MAGDPISAPTSIPIRSRNRSTMAPPPVKHQQPTFSQMNGRATSMPDPYGHGPFLGNNSPGQSSSSFTPETQSGPTSVSSLSSPPTTSPELSKLAASLESMKEPEPTRFPFSCPAVTPAKVRFPLIDSPEPDSHKDNNATSAPLAAANGKIAEDDDPPAYDYETEEEDRASDNQSERSVAISRVVTHGQPGLWQAPEQPEPKKAEIVGIPAAPVPVASGQNVRFTKTRDEYVKYLVNLFRQHEFRTGCTTPRWLEKYPSIKEAAQEVADSVYGIRKKEEETEEKKDKNKEGIDQGSEEETKEDDKAKEECQAQGHQPTPAEPSPPQSSFNNAGHRRKGRKVVTRVFRKIKNLFKKKGLGSQVYEMAELTRAQTNVPKGKEREVATASAPSPKAENAKKNTKVENGHVVESASATIARPHRVGYTEEKGETSAQGAKRNYGMSRESAECLAMCNSYAKSRLHPC